MAWWTHLYNNTVAPLSRALAKTETVAQIRRKRVRSHIGKEAGGACRTNRPRVMRTISGQGRGLWGSGCPTRNEKPLLRVSRSRGIVLHCKLGQQCHSPPTSRRLYQISRGPEEPGPVPEPGRVPGPAQAPKRKQRAGPPGPGLRPPQPYGAAPCGSFLSNQCSCCTSRLLETRKRIR